MKFEDIKFDARIQKALKDLKFDEATEIQEKTIPLIIEGKTVVAKSYTGSGKTAAFGISAAERILQNKNKGVLIIGPTRELIVQVKTEVAKINRYTKLKVLAVYGGHGLVGEVKAIKSSGVDILCATPGRLLDHIKHNVIKKTAFDCIVLDEADRMLDMGFSQDIQKILDFFNPKNLHLFSATINEKIIGIVKKHIKDYELVSIKKELTGNEIIEQKIDMRESEKYPHLVEIIKKSEGKKILVFVETKTSADNLVRKLDKQGFFVASIHGDKTQKFREIALSNFKSNKIHILVATNVAARGLHIDDVEIVVNYDRARDKDTHTHRIGRTGRMGKKGIAITFVTDNDSFFDNARRSFNSRGDNKLLGRKSSRNRNSKFGHGTKSPRGDIAQKFGLKSFDPEDRLENRRPSRDSSRKDSFDFNKRDSRDFKSKRPKRENDFKSKRTDSKKELVSNKKFVPKSFRGEKEYMFNRPEYKSRSNDDRPINKSKDNKFGKRSDSKKYPEKKRFVSKSFQSERDFTRSKRDSNSRPADSKKPTRSINKSRDNKKRR